MAQNLLSKALTKARSILLTGYVPALDGSSFNLETNAQIRLLLQLTVHREGALSVYQYIADKIKEELPELEELIDLLLDANGILSWSEQDFEEGIEGKYEKITALDFVRRNPLTKENTSGEAISERIKEYFREASGVAQENPNIPTDEELDKFYEAAKKLEDWLRRYLNLEPQLDVLQLISSAQSYAYTLMDEVQDTDTLPEEERIAAMAGYLALIALVENRPDPIGYLLSPDMELDLVGGPYSQEVLLTPCNPHKPTVHLDAGSIDDEDYRVKLQPYWPVVKIQAETTTRKLAEGPSAVWRETGLPGIKDEDVVIDVAVPAGFTGYFFGYDNARRAYVVEGGNPLYLLNRKYDAFFREGEFPWETPPSNKYTPGRAKYKIGFTGETAETILSFVGNEQSYTVDPERELYLVVENAAVVGGELTTLAAPLKHVHRYEPDYWDTSILPEEVNNEVNVVEVIDDNGTTLERAPWYQVAADKTLSARGWYTDERLAAPNPGPWYITADIGGHKHVRIPYTSPSYTYTEQAKDYPLLASTGGGAITFTGSQPGEYSPNVASGGQDIVRKVSKELNPEDPTLEFFLLCDPIEDEVLRTRFLRGLEGSLVSTEIYLQPDTTTLDGIFKTEVLRSSMAAIEVKDGIDVADFPEDRYGRDAQGEYLVLDPLDPVNAYSYPFKKNDVLVPNYDPSYEYQGIIEVQKVEPYGHELVPLFDDPIGNNPAGFFVAPRGITYLELRDQDTGELLDVERMQYDLEQQEDATGIGVTLESLDVNAPIRWEGDSLCTINVEQYVPIRGQLSFQVDSVGKSKMYTEWELDPLVCMDLSLYKNTTAYDLASRDVVYIEKIGLAEDNEDYRVVEGITGNRMQLAGPLSYEGHEGYGTYGRFGWYIERHILRQWAEVVDLIREAMRLRQNYEYGYEVSSIVVDQDEDVLVVDPATTAYVLQDLNGTSIFSKGVLKLNERGRPLRVKEATIDQSQVRLVLNGKPANDLLGETVDLGKSPIQKAYHALLRARTSLDLMYGILPTLHPVSDWYAVQVHQAKSSAPETISLLFEETSLVELLEPLETGIIDYATLNELIEELIDGS